MAQVAGAGAVRGMHFLGRIPIRYFGMTAETNVPGGCLEKIAKGGTVGIVTGPAFIFGVRFMRPLSGVRLVIVTLDA